IGFPDSSSARLVARLLWAGTEEPDQVTENGSHGTISCVASFARVQMATLSTDAALLPLRTDLLRICHGGHRAVWNLAWCHFVALARAALSSFCQRRLRSRSKVKWLRK